MQFVDKREFETRMRIVRATSKLMQDGSLNKISTAAICDAAEVSRTTFYRYFKDKYEIPQWHFQLIASTYLYEAGRSLSFYDANRLNTLEIQREREFYLPVFKTTGYQSLKEQQRRELVAVYSETLEKHKGVHVDEELSFQLRAYVVASTEAILEWGLRGMVMPADRLAHLLEGIVPARLHSYLKEASEPKNATRDFRL